MQQDYGTILWNDANVLVLSARLTTTDLAKEIIDAWLSVTEPEEDEKPNIRKIVEHEERS